MKRGFKYLIFTFVLFLVCIISVKAASFSVKSSSTNVKVGSTFNVTVSVSGAAGWEYCVAYDSSVFSFVSSGADTGSTCVKTGSTMTGYSSVKYTFKAIKSGSGTFSIKDANAYNDDAEVISASKGSVTVSAKTQAEIEASYSTNADLKSLGVEGFEISPAFARDTLEYTLDVENDVETINISAAKSDNSASVSGTGEVNLQEGTNKFEIIVTAEKGNKKTYVLTVNRKELNPITVKIDGKDYSVVRKIVDIESPLYYTQSTVVINDEEVPAFTSEITGYTLVLLKDENGEINFYIVQDNDYILYEQLGLDGFVFVPLDNKDKVKGYEKEKEITINDIKVIGYCNDENSDFVLVYGMNVTNGNKDWYKYDTKENTFQRYVDEEGSTSLNKIFKNNTFVLLLGGGMLLILLIIFVLLIISNHNLKRKNNKMYSILERQAALKRKESEVEEDSDEEDDETEEDDDLEDDDSEDDDTEEEDTKEDDEVSEDDDFEEEKLEKVIESVEDDDDDFEDLEPEEEVIEPPKRKRGRPKKNV